MPLVAWVRLLLAFSIACHGVLLWRLWHQKLARQYAFLTAYLSVEVAQAVVLLPVNSKTYQYIFFASAPVVWVFAYLVVLELYRLILEDYPGIAGAGRKAVSWSLGLAAVISVAYAIPDLKTTGGSIHIYVVLERSTVLGILLCLVLIQLFLFRYRLRLSPNRIIYATGYGIYFALNMALDVVVASLGIRAVLTLNLLVNVAASALLLVGAALLSQKGEVKPQLETADSSAERARLQQQLADINSMLSRAARSRG
jgi:hypothetical protein